ncbi:beta-lactamase family protein [Dokdonia sp. MED134]|uniref:serine hydrolase domain-containing protein n=1 Tax=Dokdonia sp. MED134 TaxID=313590 RepID=UPI000068CF44|nr:serine hydrolase domain-containing protein [Dokdonia sp. MED134]EAQ39541.1 beta-lactamase family protein [Dokdonia sp. MED134]
MKKLLKIFTILGLGVLCYFLFEPVFHYPVGWKELPLQQDEKLHTLHTDTTLFKYDNMLESLFKKMDNPSLSIAVGYKGKVYWSNTIGYKDISKKQQATEQTQYRLGSTSKAVTSMGLSLLLEKKILQLSDTAGDYIPSLPENLKNITVAQLASHTSGIRNYRTCFCFPIWETLNNDSYINVDEALSIFKDDDLLFEPGTDFSYSSYNYTLLSAIMERAAEKDFTTFMKEDVFERLHMNNTQAETERMDKNHLAFFYDIEKGFYKKSFTVNNSNKWAGGGFVSTPLDLVRMSNALMTTSFISAETKSLIWTPINLTNGLVNNQNYALGWRSDITEKVSDRSTPIVHHAGVANGSSSVLILFPEYEMSISILTNNTNQVSELFDIAYEFANTFIKDLSGDDY